MNVKKLVRQAQTLWPESRHYRKAWVRSVLRMNEKWLLAVPVRRTQ
jgi:hypothetical protein